MGMTHIKESMIQCDEKKCGWIKNVPFDEIKNWHNKACPKCKSVEIINDEDLAAWEAIDALLSLDGEIDPNGELPRIDIKIDTSSSRYNDCLTYWCYD